MNEIEAVFYLVIFGDGSYYIYDSFEAMLTGTSGQDEWVYSIKTQEEISELNKE